LTGNNTVGPSPWTSTAMTLPSCSLAWAMAIVPALAMEPTVTAADPDRRRA
jgi:hypothetical protein